MRQMQQCHTTRVLCIAAVLPYRPHGAVVYEGSVGGAVSRCCTLAGNECCSTAVCRDHTAGGSLPQVQSTVKCEHLPFRSGLLQTLLVQLGSICKI